MRRYETLSPINSNQCALLHRDVEFKEVWLLHAELRAPEHPWRDALSHLLSDVHLSGVDGAVFRLKNPRLSYCNIKKRDCLFSHINHLHLTVFINYFSLGFSLLLLSSVSQLRQYITVSFIFPPDGLWPSMTGLKALFPSPVEQNK